MIQVVRQRDHESTGRRESVDVHDLAELRGFRTREARVGQLQLRHIEHPPFKRIERRDLRALRPALFPGLFRFAARRGANGEFLHVDVERHQLSLERREVCALEHVTQRDVRCAARRAQDGNVAERRLQLA